MYHDFAEYFISGVVGKQVFVKRSWKLPFSKFVSVSDEAFALLVFENNYDRWLDMACCDNWNCSAVRPIYTTGGNITQTPKIEDEAENTKRGKHKKQTNDQVRPTAVKNSSSTSMYQGWSVQGICCFNELYDLVAHERSTKLGKDFDKNFLESCQEKKVNPKGQNQRNQWSLSYAIMTCGPMEIYFLSQYLTWLVQFI